MSEQPRRERPLKRPDAVLLVHEASTGPAIFDGWARWFPDATVVPIDLHAGLRVERATMDLYAGAVIAEAGRLPWPLLLCGLGAGGLVAMVASQILRPELLVVIEPFPSAEILESHPNEDPSESNVADPRVQSRPDSEVAVKERARGISVPAPLGGRSLVVYGEASSEARGRAVATLYGSEELSFEGLGHFDLVLDGRVPQAIARYARFDVAGEPLSS